MRSDCVRNELITEDFTLGRVEMNASDIYFRGRRQTVHVFSKQTALVQTQAACSVEKALEYLFRVFP